MSTQNLLRATLLLVLVSATGLTYAKTSGAVSGISSTSNIDWYFTKVQQLDEGLDWTCDDGFNNIRQLNKNIASTTLSLLDGPDNDLTDEDLMTIVVDNAYPCNYNKIMASIKITGTLPMKLQSIKVNGISQPLDFSSKIYDLDLSGDGVPDIELKITPKLLGDLQPGSTYDIILEYHIFQSCPENAYLNFQIQFEATESDFLMMSARTIGYWKTHPAVWADWQPSPDSIFYGKTQEKLLSYFPRNAEVSKQMNILEMLRAQLLAAELNIYYFNARFDYSRYNPNIYETINSVEDLLNTLPTDLNGYWTSLSKQQQTELRKIVTPLKDTLDLFNNMGDTYL